MCPSRCLRYSKSDKLIVASIDEKESLQLLNVEERQALKDSEDLLIDNMLILDSTFETVSSLLQSYRSYCDDCADETQELGTDPKDLIMIALEDHQKEVLSNRRKIETLYKKVKGSIQLVSPVHLLAGLQGL